MVALANPEQALLSLPYMNCLESLNEFTAEATPQHQSKKEISRKAHNHPIKYNHSLHCLL